MPPVDLLMPSAAGAWEITIYNELIMTVFVIANLAVGPKGDFSLSDDAHSI